jgi:hypothetical protein
MKVSVCPSWAVLKENSHCPTPVLVGIPSGIFVGEAWVGSHQLRVLNSTPRLAVRLPIESQYDFTYGKGCFLGSPRAI